MAIARVVASRSNCVKRKVAAVITRDRRIISTGYNGTPRGTRNCNEGGCPRCNGFAEGGTRLDECLCSHGEENAITQAAYHGVLGPRRHHLHHLLSLPDLHQDDHQRGPRRGGLQRGLPAGRRIAVAAPGGGREGEAGGAGRRVAKRRASSLRRSGRDGRFHLEFCPQRSQLPASRPPNSRRIAVARASADERLSSPAVLWRPALEQEARHFILCLGDERMGTESRNPSSKCLAASSR